MASRHIASEGRSSSELSEPSEDENTLLNTLNGSQLPRTEEEESTQLTHLQNLIKDGKLDMLEEGVQEGLKILESIIAHLKRQPQDQLDVISFYKQVENLKKAAVRPRTIVGVVGSTGAGKSSVINAILDEERILPTNPLRACTAVVTEVSWNDHDDPEYRYRAEVEFITAQEWAKELKILFDDLVTDDSSQLDGEASVAYAKLTAVYPSLPQSAMTKNKIKDFLKHHTVKDLFGTTKQIQQKEPGRFYTELRKYVDSKNRGNAKSEEEPKLLEYWPLIKQVITLIMLFWHSLPNSRSL